MKQSKRIVLFLLSFLLVITLFGCGTGSSNQSQTTAISSTTSASASTAVSSTAPKEPAKIVVLQADYGFSKKDDIEKQVHDKIMEKTNVDLQMVCVTYDQLTNKMNLMLSAGEQLDIIPNLDYPTVTNLYSKGVAIPLTDLFKNAPNIQKDTDPKIWREATASDGQIIAYPNPIYISNPYCLQIRDDWVKKLNMQMPVTIEDYEKIMDAFKNNDPDKNGKADTYALNVGTAGSAAGSFKELDYVFDSFFLPNGYANSLDSNGKLIPPELDPNYKTLLSKIRDWYKKGYIFPDFLTVKQEKMNELVAKNEIGSFAGYYSAYIYNANDILVKSVPDAHYEPVILQGINGAINKYVKQRQMVTAIAVTKSCKDPEAAVRLIDFHVSKEGYYLMTYGIEGISYKNNADGTLSYLGDDPTNYAKAPYYGAYYFLDSPVVPIIGSGWTDRRYNEYKATVPKLPNFESIDFLVNYDQAKWKSKEKLTDLDTYLDEQKVRIMVGEIPVENWDKIMAKWRTMGGDLKIEDQTAQYNAAQKK